MRAWAWGPAGDHADEESRVYLKDVAKATNMIIDEQNVMMGDADEDDAGEKKKWGSRGIKGVMKKNLNIQSERSTSGSKNYKGTAFVKWDEPRIRGLCTRWDVEWLERGSVGRPILVSLSGGVFKSEEVSYDQSGLGDENGEGWS